jgi:hypothetical protein
MLGRLHATRRYRTRLLALEWLEDRANPSLMTPAQITHAYGFDQVAAVNGTALTGAGQTIAIVDAYYDANAQSDLATFDSQYHLPAPPTFTQVNQTGGSPSSLQTDAGWSGETALDIEWAHAIAPGANILLVEASDSGGSLYTAVDYARRQPGVSVVSMSWGGGESSGESSLNSHFTTPSGHAGVSFFAASGDTGGELLYPSASPNVVSVGGTSLTLSGGNYGSESAWSSGGGGNSSFISKPSWQSVNPGSFRGTPDVSYDADPNTGFSVYNTAGGGWEQVGGTSASSPQWAALVALAYQGRTLIGFTSLDGQTQLLPALYSLPSTDFHDITTGSNGHSATAGYDLATGLGTPKAQLVIADLIAYGTTTAPAVTTQPASQLVVAGQSVTFTAAANGHPAPTVQWQVSIDGGVTFTDIAGATSTSYTFTVTSADTGHLFRAVFTNSAGAATTSAATLTLATAPAVTGQPSNQSVTAGQSVTFAATASGNPAPTVQWQVSIDGGVTFTDIAGATSAGYTFTVTSADNGHLFRAVFTNMAGSVTTAAASLSVAVPNPPASIASIVVNDGSAQRSEVQSIAVTFSGKVNFAFGDSAASLAFQLLHVQTGGYVSLNTAVSVDAQGRTVVTLTFSGTETDPVSALNGGAASLADGRYQLNIDATMINDTNGNALDGNGDGVAGGNYSSPADTFGGTGLHLYRLFGDVSGDGVVDATDLGQFRSTFNANTSQANYLAFLDADNSGAVDASDLGQFRSRFNVNVF